MMIKIILLPILITLSIGIFLTPVTVHAWCWIRDTGNTDINCSPETTYQRNCCTGNLRIWNSAAMTYRVSTSTSTTLHSDIESGFNRWNSVEMSTYVFTRGSDTPSTAFAQDGINIVNIDASFCAHYPYYCGMGILGGSSTWTSSSGGYHAVESDILLNAEEYTWGDGTGGTFDTIAVITHEAGHNAGVTHPGSTCRNSGSSGCGPEFSAATMYYNYSGGQPTDKSSLELDDVASIVYGYPRSTFRVQVLDSSDLPVTGKTVELVGTAAPVNGSGITIGGTVYGDISASLMGDGASSSTYVSATPFSATDGSGYTDYIKPVHRSFQLRVSHNGKTFTKNVTVAYGLSTIVMDLFPPAIQGIYLLLLY